MPDQREFMTGLHKVFRPRTYLEIGVATGGSLALSRARSIGVDPGFQLTFEIECDVQLVREPSDDFFARADPTAHFRGKPADLVYIDGLHVFEYALRDFMNAERYCAGTSAILLDDVMPRNIEEAARERHTGAWAGDVFKMLPVLHEYRPDLQVIPVNTYPCGTLVVLGVDPTSRVLPDAYDEIVSRYATPDPQAVPEPLLRRSFALDRASVLAMPVWAQLRRARGALGRVRPVDVTGSVESSLSLASTVGPALAGMVGPKGPGSPEQG